MLFARSDPTYLFYHRGFTHSLLGLAVLPPILAAGLWWGYRRRTGFGWFCRLAYLGVGLHIVYDVVTPWGTMLLYPFDLTRFALDWLFIVDPVTWALPLLAALHAWRRPHRARAGAVTLILALALYAGVAGRLHARAERAIVRAESAAGRAPTEVFAFPRFGAPLRWNGVAIAPPHVPEPRIARYRVGGVPPRARLRGRLDRGLEGPWVRRALATPAAQEYLWWARVPVARTRSSGGTVVVALRDLRFTTPFAVRFRFDPATSELLEIVW